MQIALAVLSVVVVVGVVLSRVGGDPPQSGVNPSVTAGQQPLVRGFDQPATTATAQQAAVAAVGLTDEVARAGFISRRELIESFTTSSFGPALADSTSEQLNALLLEFSERDADASQLQVTEQPLRVRTIVATTKTATVEVWSVLVIAPPTATTARALWRTVTLDMKLVDERWLVDGWKSVAGPTPLVGAESPISSATEVAAVLSWTVATGEVG